MTGLSWPRSCGDCIRLFNAYDRADSVEASTEASRALHAHLAAEHRNMLPISESCAKCQDFRRVRMLPARWIPASIAEILDRGYDEHRASHLVAMLYERRAG